VTVRTRPHRRGQRLLCALLRPNRTDDAIQTNLFDRFFLSTDATLSANDTFIGEYFRPDNLPGAGTSYTREREHHVPSVAPGSYYLILVHRWLRESLPESDETNNNDRDPGTVGQADLVCLRSPAFRAGGGAAALRCRGR